MLIAVAQISSTESKTDNLVTISKYTAKAAAQGARMVIFPEASMQAFGTGRLDKAAEDLDQQFVSRLIELSTAKDIAIVAGLFRPADRSGEINRIYNTVVMVKPTGELIYYDKIHTYDAFGYQESRTVKAGDRLQVFDYEGINFGIATCYDLRFPEQFRQLAQRGAEVIVVVMSWAGGEGKLEQKQLLLRARALDSTSWVISCDQAEHPDLSAPRGVGHSIFVNPLGTVVAECGAEKELKLYDVDTQGLSAIREKLPVLAYDESTYSQK